MERRVSTDLEALIETLPPPIREPLSEWEDNELLELVLDLGREPEARFLTHDLILAPKEVAEQDLQYVIDRVSAFGDDNRAGIGRTLHRISAIRNRSGKVVGLSLRVGRAVYGTIRIIEDLIFTGKSLLLVGKPGVGKTTMLREVARVLAEDAHKRVIVVDTSNEIAGDGDIPHPGIGRARRMQVKSPSLQHAVMIEAVENHMPEVIVIDEIGTELDALAARTIAERGVQLVGTAHGNTLENLIINPTLSDLVGGVQTVILGDEEARRRRTQKTIQERRAPPTFDILVEIQGWDRVAIHPDVAEVVDRMLRGSRVAPQTRTIDEEGSIQYTETQAAVIARRQNGGRSELGQLPVAEVDSTPLTVTRILPYGVNKGKLQQVVRSTRAAVELANDIKDADLLLTTKSYYRRRTQALRMAEEDGKPVYVLRKNTTPQIEQFVRAINRKRTHEYTDRHVETAVREVEEAAARIDDGETQVVLNPQGAYVRHVQHKIAETYGLASSSAGREPGRHVVIYRR